MPQTAAKPYEKITITIPHEVLRRFKAQGKYGDNAWNIIDRLLTHFEETSPEAVIVTDTESPPE